MSHTLQYRRFSTPLIAFLVFVFNPPLHQLRLQTLILTF